jgi:hypothetical protein
VVRQVTLPRLFSWPSGNLFKENQLMRILVFSMALACFSISQPSRPLEAGTATAPVLIEFFTSDGCSSCPPVDVWLQQLEESQPIPGAQAILLSEHVDYFDHDGWKDPYSSPMMTDRQRGYVRALGLKSLYTPQVIVDGKTELPLNDPQRVNQLLLKAATAPMVPVRISEIRVEGDSPAILRTHIEADGASENRNAAVFAAVALGHVETQVSTGENGGRHLVHISVVEQLIKIGKLEKGKTFSQDFQTRLKPGTDPRNLQLIVFVQEQNHGNVLGAALEQIGVSDR